MDRSTLLQMLFPALAALAGAAVGAAAFGVTGAAVLAAAGAALGVRLRQEVGGTPAGRDVASAQPDRAGGHLPAGYGRLLLEKLPVGILLIDRRGRVQFMNAMATRLFGRRPPGQFHLSALRTPRLIEAIEAALADRQAASVTFGLARTGSSDLRASLEPLAASGDADDTPTLAVMIEDHSQPRRAAELHRDFVANASHELKTPLASISGIIETLTGHARDDPEATERFLRMMAAQVERMKRLVQDLLSLNRIELNERVRPEEPQSLRRIAWEAAQALEPTAAAEGVTLRCDPPADRPLVAGDRQELMQLFSNLIDNAIKYGGDGGEVAVRVENAESTPGRIGIAVIDNGPGIAREHLPRLTERFYRVSASHSRARGGTGLGLAIAKHVVNRHRGELKVESTPGEGSTFTVWLPVLEAEAEREPALAGSRPA